MHGKGILLVRFQKIMNAQPKNWKRYSLRYSFHGTFKTAQDICLDKKFHADLRLCWYVGALEILTPQEADALKEKLVGEVKSGKAYEKVLKEGQLELFKLLKEKSCL